MVKVKRKIEKKRIEKRIKKIVRKERKKRRGIPRPEITDRYGWCSYEDPGNYDVKFIIENDKIISEVIE